MIIKSGTVKSGDGTRAANYPFKPGDNERVIVLKDDRDQLIVADEFAELKGRKNGLIHTTINPGQELTPDQWERALEAVRAEHGFNPDGPETFVIHESQRADGSLQQHGHFFTTAADSENGKTYKRFRSKGKDEAVSRLLELEFGHKLISGKHNQFAAMRLREMCHHDYADQVAALDGDKPQAAYSHDQHQQAKRQNFDLPGLRQQLKELADLPSDKQPQKLAELLDREGLELADAIEEGRGRSRIMIQTPEGVKNHNANRTLKIKAAEVAKLISETKEILHDLRSDTSHLERDLGAGSTDSAHQEPKPDYQQSGPDNQRSGTDASDQQRACEAEQSPSGSAGSSSEDRSTEQLANAAAELAKATADLKSDNKKFAASRGEDFTAADLDAPPDLSDPNLMKKLAAMLKKCLGGVTRVVARVLSPNEGMPG